MRWLAEQGVKSPQEWLAASGGAPVQAQRAAQSEAHACPLWLEGLVHSLQATRATDLGTLADTVARLPTASWLDALSRASVDLNLAAQDLGPRYYPGLGKSTRAIAVNCDARKLSDLGKWLAEQSRIASHPLNSKLFAQSALQRVVASCQPRLNK